MRKTSRYKNNRSAQQTRQIERNRARNIPRLNRLKETFGCHACGRCDIPGEFLDGHHVNENSKYKPLAWLVNRNWNRVVSEIIGLRRGERNGGGPIVFVCQRFHEDQHARGDKARLCTELGEQGVRKPYRRKSRKPFRKHRYGKLKKLITKFFS